MAVKNARGHSPRPVPGERAGRSSAAHATRAPATLVETVLDLQRLAGNRAVREELAAVQREDVAPATDSKFVEYSDKWPDLVTARLVDAKDVLAASPLTSMLLLQRALNFVAEVFDAIPSNDPIHIKVRIFGRGLAGIVDVLGDRLGIGKDREKGRTEDLRTWRREADDLGPQLRVGPNGQPAKPQNWKEGVVYPLGRAILKSGQEPKVAVSEASLALEVVHMWRDGTPKSDANRLKLASLERGVSISLDRLREAAYGAGEVDLAKNLETTIAESKVIGPQVADVKPPPPQAPTPAPVGAGGPFVNDTELMRP